MDDQRRDEWRKLGEFLAEKPDYSPSRWETVGGWAFYFTLLGLALASLYVIFSLVNP